MFLYKGTLGADRSLETMTGNISDKNNDILSQPNAPRRVIMGCDGTLYLSNASCDLPPTTTTATRPQSIVRYTYIVIEKQFSLQIPS